ncbi:LysR substrate-binding domain-containing protein [Franconibacter pulveris]|uniref:LysR substrate-binding domain-containing protein n=1 Tax=Franconibacter pulveris TaxID=435910 RepID=UPI00049565F8|nr:LysR substrate-binding domain-containing protein [Franconibacter pulveris]
MDKLPVALDTDALRSFVTGIELGSFALAAGRLCRSTSAVSAQLRKLEQQCGTTLVTKQGRGLALTPGGELLLSYARRLLALNDEALLAVKGELLQGEISLGMQEDFGETLMPEILGQFSRQHPGLRLTAHVERNKALVEGIARGELDLALAWQPETLPAGACLLKQLALQWISHPMLDLSAYLNGNAPLPLVVFDAPCLMRSRAIAALDRANIAWRIAFTSRSLSGIWAAVSAGLGVTVRTRLGMPASLMPLPALTLPSPGSLGVALLKADNRASPPLTQLSDVVKKAVQSSI